jgi:hypothetical protein
MCQRRAACSDSFMWAEGVINPKAHQRPSAQYSDSFQGAFLQLLNRTTKKPRYFYPAGGWLSIKWQTNCRLATVLQGGFQNNSQNSIGITIRTYVTAFWTEPWRRCCGAFTPCKNSNLKTRSRNYATVDKAVFSLCHAESRLTCY